MKQPALESPPPVPPPDSSQQSTAGPVAPEPETVSHRRVTRAEIAGVLALLAAGAFLRFYFLDRLSLWGDELVMAIFSEWPVDAILVHRRQVVLQHLILHFLLPWLGRNDFVLRLPTAIYGTLSIPLMYVFVRRFIDRPTAFLATFLVAANYAHLLQSQNARYYGFMFLATLASMYVMFGMVRRFRWWLVPLFVLIHALNLLNHIAAFFVLASEVLYLAVIGASRVRKLERGRRSIVLSIGAAVAIVAAIGAFVFRTQVLTYIPLASPDELSEMAARNGRLFLFSTARFLGVAVAWQYYAAAVFAVSLIALFFKSRRMFLFTLILYVTTFGGLLAVKWFWEDLPERYVFFCQPALLIAVSTLPAGLVQLAARVVPADWRRGVLGAGYGIVAAVALVWGWDNVWRYTHRAPEEDWRGVVEHLQAHADRDDYVLIARTSRYATEFLRWYLPNPQFSVFSLTSGADTRPTVEKIQALEVAGRKRAVWLFSVYDRDLRAEPGMERLLAGSFETIGRFGRKSALYRTPDKESFQVPGIWGWRIPVGEEAGFSSPTSIERRFSVIEPGDYVFVIRSTPNVSVEHLRIEGRPVEPSGSSGEPRLAKRRLEQGDCFFEVTVRPDGWRPGDSAYLEIRVGQAFSPAADEVLMRGPIRNTEKAPLILWAYGTADNTIRPGEAFEQRIYWKFQDLRYLEPRFGSILYHAEKGYKIQNRLVHSRIFLGDDGLYVMQHRYRADTPADTPPGEYAIQIRFLPEELGIQAYLMKAAEIVEGTE